jgi:hypothetical protein
MIVYRMRHMILLAAFVAVLVVLASASGAGATPVKLTLTSQFGSEVNRTQVTAKGGPALEDVCTVASKNECQQGVESTLAGGFKLPEGVAAAPSGDVYVVDASNKRIQEFSASGQFVLMFGWDVNKTKVEKGLATQQEMNVCTETEIEAKGECQAGTEGGAPGQFDHPYGVAVDPVSGDLYVNEIVEGPHGQGERIQKLTPEGQFVFEIGKDVNETKGTNLCTHVEEVSEHVVCIEPGGYVPEPGSFDFEGECGDLLAVGHEGKLYVGDEGRVQEFAETGQSSGEVLLEAGTRVDALAVDAAGDLYLTDDTPGNLSDIVREFDTSGDEIKHFTVSPEEVGAEVAIHGLALDAQGHLAVAADQKQQGGSETPFGSLYEASGAKFLTAFKIPSAVVRGIDFSSNVSSNGVLYVAGGTSQEVLQYTPKPVAALATNVAASAKSCVPGAERETDVTLNCTLVGEVDPEGVPATEASFGWGPGSETKCGLGSLTPKRAAAAAGQVEAPLEGLRPDESYCFQLAVEDENAKAPEALRTGLASFRTKLAPPRIVGDPQVQFVKASSAVMFIELNPENGPTKYFFEYAAGHKALAQCESFDEECYGRPKRPCSSATTTTLGQSGVYGSIGATSEALGLRPGSEYSYRLFAEDEYVNKEEKEEERCGTTSSEGSFITATVPSPSATTGVSGAVGATSAVLYATITPEGAPVTYSFELGVYEGANTQYGVVSSGTVEPDGGSVEVSHALSGLQPGTTYAYRIAISSGYIDNETHTLQGQAKTFPTSGLPAILQPPIVLTQLPAPPIKFPTVASKAKPKTKAKAKAKKKAKRGKAKKGKKARRSAR